MSDDFNFAELIDTFVNESRELLQAMEEHLVELELAGDRAEVLADLFRSAHTLKGSASCVGFEATTAAAHLLEDRLADLRDGSAGVTASAVNDLLAFVDHLRSVVDGDILAIRQPGREEGVARSASVSRTLRIGVEKLDGILNVAGEIAIARARLEAVIAELPERLREPVLEVHREADRLYADLHEMTMKARTVPIGPLFRRFSRAVRDAATRSGKSAVLEVRGAEVEVDMALVESLRDPLTHILRNAVDHGIEPAERRRAAGKPAAGRIVLEATQAGGQLVVTATDDGAGFDPERIVSHARARGLIAPTQVLSREQILDLVFLPGFSTAEQVTDISGRGVGMDVVRKNVERSRGRVTIDSRPGRGSTVEIRMPLTLSILQALIVRAGGDVFYIPLDAVVACADVPISAATSGGTGLLELRGESIPSLRLRPPMPGQTRELAILVQQPGALVAVLVDALDGQTQAVVKPVGPLFRDARGVAGATIVADGSVAVILDVSAIIAHAASVQHSSWMTRSLSSAGSNVGGLACFNG